MYDIVVLGAGAVGLSTAVCIQNALPGRRVTIIADKFTTETTSHGAAGIFRPTTEKTPVKSLEQFRKWCTDSFAWFHLLNTELDPAQTGVSRVTGYQFLEQPNEKLPFHHDIIYNFRTLTDQELTSLPGNHKAGWTYTTLMIESRRYLPWLTKRFLSQGGTLESRTVNDIRSFAGRCSVLVNCCGLGAAPLCNDPDVFPVRGHLVRVLAPWMKHFYVWDGGDSYIYPGQDNIAIGGTRHVGEYDVIKDADYWFKDVLDRSTRLFPALKDVHIDRKWVGLRPHRTYLRLETETVRCGEQTLKVVHNYGHGANGIALSWGTSLEAAALVRQTSVAAATLVRQTSSVNSKL